MIHWIKSFRDPEHEGRGDKTDSHVLVASIYRRPHEEEVKEKFFGQSALQSFQFHLVTMG